MALIKCPECGKEISDKASACPNCGCPSSEFKEKEANAAEGLQQPVWSLEIPIRHQEL